MKRDGIDFFLMSNLFIYSFFTEVSCDVSNFRYIHNGLDNVVWLLKEISISHRIFFLCFFYLHFYRTSTTFMGTMWKFLNISTWVWNISKFSRSLFFFALFQQQNAETHTLKKNRCYANNLKQRSIRLIGENYQQQQCVTTDIFYVFRFLSQQQHQQKSRNTQNVNDLWERNVTFFCLVLFFALTLASYNKFVITSGNLIKAVHKSREKSHTEQNS